MSTQLWKRSIVLGSIWHTFELLEYWLNQRSSTLLLQSLFSTCLSTPAVYFQVILKSLIRFYRFVWLELKLNSAGHWVPRSRTEDLWVKLFISSSSDFFSFRVMNVHVQFWHIDVFWKGCTHFGDYDLHLVSMQFTKISWKIAKM